MQATRTTPKKAPKFLDTKIFIAASSIAVTIGLWTIYSQTALLDEVAAQKAVEVAPVETPFAADLGLPPLPTIIPLVEGQPQRDVVGVPQGQSQPGNLPLRSVNAPDQVIVQKVKPIFEEQEVVVISGGSSSSGNNRPAPRARSSR